MAGAGVSLSVLGGFKAARALYNYPIYKEKEKEKKKMKEGRKEEWMDGRQAGIL